MRGHIRKKTDGVYYVRIELPRGLDGRRRQRRITVTGTKKDAELKAAELIRQVNTGSIVDVNRTAFARYLDEWLEMQKSDLAESTFRRYSAIVRDYLRPTLGSLPLSQISPIHIQMAINVWKTGPRRDRKRGNLSPRTISHAFGVLSAALRQANRWQLISNNPCDSVKSPRFEAASVRALNLIEARELLSGLKHSELYSPVAIALYTGVRRGELLALRWSNIDLLNRRMRINSSIEKLANGQLRFKRPKTKRSTRSVALPPFAISVLEELHSKQSERASLFGFTINDASLVFGNLDGSPIDPDVFSSHFYYTIRAKRLPQCSFHALRHTYATFHLAAGTPMKVTSEALGHSSTAITADLYTDVLESLHLDAADRFDLLLSGKAESASIRS